MLRRDLLQPISPRKFYMLTQHGAHIVSLWNPIGYVVRIVNLRNRNSHPY